MTRISGGKGGERGSALIEAAMIFPLLALFLLSIVQYGFILSAQITLRSASAVGARAAVLDGASDTGAETAAIEAIQPMLDAAYASADCTGATVNGLAAKKMTITYNLPLIIPYVVPGSSGGIMTLTASTTMR